MTNPQRVDVARLTELLAVMASSDPNRMTEFPGGCDCYECGNIFIGGAGHDYCAQCEAKRQLLAMLPEVLPALLQQLAEKDEALRVADLFQQLVIGEGAWERFQDLTKRAESAESKLAEQAAEIERLGECLRVFICDCQQWSYDSLDTEGGKRIALEWMTRYNGNKRRAEAAERAREELAAEVNDIRARHHDSILSWEEETRRSSHWRECFRAYVERHFLSGGMNIEQARIHADASMLRMEAAFLAANGGRDE